MPSGAALARGLAVACALCLPGPPARAAGPSSAPLFTGSSAAPAPAADELLVFKGTLLLNEYVYRSVLALPADARASPALARQVAARLASFLRDAGYDLARVRAQVQGERIAVEVDEGALDQIIVTGTGWLTAMRFRNALDLPLEVFNRRLFEAQMPGLARRFGMRGYRYELLPVHALDSEPTLLEGVEELRAMPMLRPARGYELRIFAETEPWSSGFSPEVVLNGSIGVGLGGRYRWKDLLQEGDRWQAHVRAGAASRSSLDPAGSSRYVNSNDYLSARWLSRSWNGSGSGLRLTVAPRAELWTLQRKDLLLESYKVGTLELGAGAGAQLLPEFALYFTTGLQRRWLYGVQPAAGATEAPDVARVPSVSNRAFLRASAQVIFNPEELRHDRRHGVTLELTGYRPARAGDDGYLRVDLQAMRQFFFGWNELRAGARVGAELGDVWFVDELPLEDHFRIGFSLEKYTHRAASLNLELRYSLLRDRVKVGPFADFGTFRHLPRVDRTQAVEYAGSTGGGVFLFLFDQLQLDVLYGVGWASDGFSKTGLSLAIKDVF